MKKRAHCYVNDAQKQAIPSFHSYATKEIGHKTKQIQVNNNIPTKVNKEIDANSDLTTFILRNIIDYRQQVIMKLINLNIFAFYIFKSKLPKNQTCRRDPKAKEKGDILEQASFHSLIMWSGLQTHLS